MTAILLATTCAMVYGMADFFGGLATKRSRVLAVVMLGQILGLLAVLPLLPLLPGTPSIAALTWGMAAGLCGSLAVIFFYRALAGGVMSVVAPTTATMSAALPVLAGFALGERPEPLTLVGVAVAMVAVMLVSRDSGSAGGRAALGPILQALGAGIGFGAFFILLKQVPDGTGMWPLVGARFSSMILVGTLALATGRTLRPGTGALPVIAVSGVLDMAANVLYLLAARQGLLVVVAVLVSLYPASTLLLARYVLKERLSPVQTTGIALALGAIALIAAA